jgi:hypothetical protein
MRSHLIGALLASATVLLAATPSQAQVVYYSGDYYAPRPIVSVNVPGVSVQVGGPVGVAVSAPFTNVYVAPRRVVTPVYGPDTGVVYTSGPYFSSRRAARRWYRGGYAVRSVGGYYYR